MSITWIEKKNGFLLRSLLTKNVDTAKTYLIFLLLYVRQGKLHFSLTKQSETGKFCHFFLFCHTKYQQKVKQTKFHSSNGCKLKNSKNWTTLVDGIFQNNRWSLNDEAFIPALYCCSYVADYIVVTRQQREAANSMC